MKITTIDNLFWRNLQQTKITTLMIEKAEIAEDCQKKQFFSKKAIINKYKCSIALGWKILG